MGRLRTSLILPVHGTAFETTLEAARAAERAGLDGVWVPDHLLNRGSPRSGVLECWTTLAAVAASTRSIGVGTLVLTTAFRQPALLAKSAATLDALAPGRVTLGVGAGGFTYADTCRQLGFPELTAAERVAHVEETLQCLRTLLSEDPASYQGRFARARDARIFPRPERPIRTVVAARGLRMLGLAARLADGWNCPLPWELEAGLARIEAAGRPRDAIEVGVFSIAVLGASDDEARRALERAGRSAQIFGDVESRHVFGGPARAIERLADLRRRGAAHVTLDVRGAPVHEMVDLLARDVLPALEGA